MSLTGHYAQNPLPRVLSDGDPVRQHGVKGQVLALTHQPIDIVAAAGAEPREQAVWTARSLKHFHG